MRLQMPDPVPRRGPIPVEDPPPNEDPSEIPPAGDPPSPEPEPVRFYMGVAAGAVLRRRDT